MEEHRNRCVRIAQMLSAILNKDVTPEQVEQACAHNILTDVFEAEEYSNVDRARHRVSLGLNPIVPARVFVDFGSDSLWQPEGNWARHNLETRKSPMAVLVEAPGILKERETSIPIKTALDRLKEGGWRVYGLHLAQAIRQKYPSEWPKINLLFPLTTFRKKGKIMMPVLRTTTAGMPLALVDYEIFRLTKEWRIPCSRQ